MSPENQCAEVSVQEESNDGATRGGSRCKELGVYYFENSFGAMRCYCLKHAPVGARRRGDKYDREIMVVSPGVVERRPL